MPLRHIQPQGLFESQRMGFTQVVTSPPGTLISISGQVGWDENLKVPGPDLASQGKKALENLTIALEAAGATPSDLLSLRIYIKDYEPANIGELGPLLPEFFGDAPPCAQTLIGVQSLAAPELRIEIEALAVVSP